MAVNPTQRSQSNHFAPRISLLGASRNIARKRPRRHELMALWDPGSSCFFFFFCFFFLFFLFGIMQEAAVSKRMNAMAHIKFNRRLVLLRRLEGERSRPSKAAARAFLWALRRPVKETPKGQGVDASSLLFALFWEKKAGLKKARAETKRAEGMLGRTRAGGRRLCESQRKTSAALPPPPPGSGIGGEGSALGFQRAWPWTLSAAVLAAGLSHASTSSASSFSGSKSTG